MPRRRRADLAPVLRELLEAIHDKRHLGRVVLDVSGSHVVVSTAYRDEKHTVGVFDTSTDGLVDEQDVR